MDEQLAAVIRRYIYYPNRLPASMPPPYWAGAAEEVWMTAADGVRLHGLWWGEPEAGPVILYLHGNAQEAYSWSLVHRDLATLGCRMLLPDYRGYGKSEGYPHEAGLYLDAAAALSWLEERGVEQRQVVVFGKSLGGGVACELAQARPLRGLVLESTFTSLASIARNLMPLPLPVELPETYPSLERLARKACPLLLIHGSHDELIPLDEGLRLFEAAPEPKELYVVQGAGHNDVSLVARGAYQQRIKHWLTATTSQ
ncbi:MAG: alpha/beta hydrolase [Candidatus Geothermincolia bacterium]